MKEKRCTGYCGVACVDGNCPIALYNEDSTMFERKPSCNDCFYYKGCEDISELKIYDKPKELSEFRKYGFGEPVPLKRPPQSWCYVEELP